MPEFLITKDAAAALGVNINRLWDWRRRGAPHEPNYFKGRGNNGGGRPGPGWDLAELRPRLRKEGLADEKDVIFQNKRTRRYAKRGGAPTA
ncbi:unnamed protein product, partial [marine sediment metagenome]